MQPPWGVRRSHDHGSGGRIIHLRVPPPPPPAPPPHPLSPPIPHSESQHFQQHPGSTSEGLVSQSCRDYGSHYTSHSQYYHPERQRRHWQTWDYGHTRPHPFTTISSHDEHRVVYDEEQRMYHETRSCGGEVDGSFPVQLTHFPHQAAERGISETEFPSHHRLLPHLPPLPAALAGHSSSSSSSFSSSAPDYPPHPVDCSVEKVSAIDLIKSSRGEEEFYTPWKEEEETKEEKEGGGVMEGLRSTHLPPHRTHSVDVPTSVDRLIWDERNDPPPYTEEMDQDRAAVATTQGQVVGGTVAQGHMERRGKEDVEEGEEEVGQVKEEGWVREREGGEETVYESSFVGEVRRFVQRNADIFNIIAEKAVSMETVPTLLNLKSDSSYKYAEPDAVEYHMQVDKHIRRQRFFKLVEVGDVVRGHVVAKRHSGLMIQITSFVSSHKYRELSDISIEGVVPFENLAENSNKCDELMSDMQLDDVVQAVVIRRDIAGELLTLSFQEHHLPENRNESLGYREGRRPASSRPSSVPEHDFLHQLEDDSGFINPQAVANLSDLLGLSRSGLRPTLVQDLQLAHYAESDYAEPLRKAQRFKWSMKTVAIGVDRFKSGAHSDAMKYFNHALDIDSGNVEGLVARGALQFYHSFYEGRFATMGKYKEGIADFQKALSIKSSHRNARKYLTETQVVYAQELEKQGSIDSAMKCYREVLTLDPAEETAKQRLGALTAAMEKQAAEKRERERTEEEERERLRKLRKMIEKEKKKRNKEKRSKTKKRKKTGKHSSRKKAKKPSHRQYDSSDESTSTVSADEDEEERERRSRSPSLPSRHHGGEGRRRHSHRSGESPSSKKSKQQKDSSNSSSDSDTSESQGRDRHRERSGRETGKEKRKKSHSHRHSSPLSPPRKEREAGRTRSSKHHSHDHSSSKYKR